MSGDQLSVIFDIVITFNGRCSQITDLGDRPSDGSDDRIGKDIRPRISPMVDRQRIEHADKRGSHDTADTSLYGFLRT